MRYFCCLFLFFFFNDTATTEIYTLSLHDALPILAARYAPWPEITYLAFPPVPSSLVIFGSGYGLGTRSEEHTSELQSLAYLVCRLLLEKKTNSSSGLLASRSSILKSRTRLRPTST